MRVRSAARPLLLILVASGVIATLDIAVFKGAPPPHGSMGIAVCAVIVILVLVLAGLNRIAEDALRRRSAEVGNDPPHEPS